MGYFKFTISLRSGIVHQFIRQIEQREVDQVWRIYEKKSKEFYKSKMSSFQVVHLSKLDPEVKEFIANQAKSSTASTWDDLYDGPEKKAPANRKKGREEGGSLIDRKV